MARWLMSHALTCVADSTGSPLAPQLDVLKKITVWREFEFGTFAWLSRRARPLGGAVRSWLSGWWWTVESELGTGCVRGACYGTTINPATACPEIYWKMSDFYVNFSIIFSIGKRGLEFVANFLNFLVEFVRNFILIIILWKPVKKRMVMADNANLE